MTIPLRTVIIPAAGQGTRLLPLTRVVPKEMLPVYDRPVLQFAIEEAVAACAERIVIIIHPSKTVIRDYLQPDPDRIGRVRLSGKDPLADPLAKIGVGDGIDVVFVMQDDPLGLGHAVLCAAPYVLPGPIGVILPDDVVFGLPCLAQMAAAYQSGHMVAAMTVPRSDTAKYGIFAPMGLSDSRSVRVSGMVEKPPHGTAPSTLAAVGRYILDARIMDTLTRTKAGRGGEVQLTDAIASDAAHLPLTAFRFAGNRYDCGTFEGLLAAGVAQQTKRGESHRAPASNSIIRDTSPEHMSEGHG